MEPVATIDVALSCAGWVRFARQQNSWRATPPTELSRTAWRHLGFAPTAPSSSASLWWMLRSSSGSTASTGGRMPRQMCWRSRPGSRGPSAPPMRRILLGDVTLAFETVAARSGRAGEAGWRSSQPPHRARRASPARLRPSDGQADAEVMEALEISILAKLRIRESVSRSCLAAGKRICLP